MDINLIKNRLSANDGYICGWREKRRASVTIPLININGEINVLFQVRALTLKHQPGDVCFPGGKIEKGESPLEGGIRETIEELGVKEENIEIIKELDVLVRYDNSIIHSYLVYINKKDFNINKEEVDHLFYVPLKYLLENSPLVVENKLKVHRAEGFPFELVRGGEKYKFRDGVYKSYFYKYNDYVIWGMTASILKGFLDMIE
ncbi:MAG: NUDIX hydrolase [Clostridium sp.]